MNTVLDPKDFGPLAQLAGVWEGSEGDDTAPSDDRGTEKNFFREVMEFEPFGPVDNHEQKLYGLRYKTTAWRKGESDAFHEEMGYWLWDAKAQQVMRCFLVPRGVSVIAGGTVAANASEFVLEAKLGSATYGICSNLFLDQEFKTISYRLQLKVDGDLLSYEENTRLQIKSKPGVFDHIDKNVLRRTKSFL